MITKKTQTVALFSGLIFLAAIVGTSGLYFLVMQKDAQLQEIVHERAERIATERQLDSLEELMANTHDQRTDILTYILTNDDVVTAVSLIERVAREHGATVETEDIRTVGISNNDRFQHIVLRVKTEGTFDAVESVLRTYDTLPFQSELQGVSLSRVGDGWEGVFDIAVTVYTAEEI